MASGQGSVNRVILIGNCGREPEARSLPSGDTVTNIRLATNEFWKDRQSGERRERTEWHSLVFFGRTAEVARDYLRSGSKIYIEGSLRTRKWEKDGVDRYSTEIVVDQMTMLDRKADAGSAPPPAGSGDSRYDAPPAAAQQGGGSSAPPAADAIEDDDIPF